MAAEADPSAPVLNLTPEEKRVFGQLFRKADHDNVGVVTGDVAVSFFEKTRLDSHILGEIWQLADKENRGFLTPPGFGVVLRLIGHAQAGREPSLELALKPGPLPRFDAIPTPAGLGSGSMPSPMIAPPPPVAAPLQAQHTAAGGPVRIPPLTPDKVAQFGALFEAQPLQAGFLSGDQARQIFEKSGLPNEILGRIWQLADTEQRGSLNSTEFVIAMHLLSALKTGAMRGLPTVLPSGLFEAASGRQSPAPTGSGIGIPPLPTQMGANPPALRPAATGARPSTATIQSQSTGFGASMSNDWLVTPLEKQRFDQFYDDLDKTRRGYITGEEAVPFFSQSDLGEEALAQIWDLSDITATGTLTRDEFSVAMYLIRSQRSGRSGPLPSVLPPKLIPPSMRGPARPSTSASPFDAPMGSPVGMSSFAPPPVPAAPAASKSALDDLFVLDSSPASPKPAAPTDVSSSSNDPFASTPTGVTKPSSPPPLFKPFIPSSSFGRGLTQNVTGDSRGSGSPAPAPASAANDLLGDNDPEMSSKLNNNSTELANLSNQISSLSTQMQNTQAQRSATQNELTQANSQKQNFEQRLTQLRSVYEKEAQNLRGLEEQLRTARSETTKLQAECMSLDGTYQDLQNQKAQVTAGLQTDQQENAALKEKIRVLNSEIAQLKPQIEKLRLEARQQKGLVAINKKQVITNEGERDKLKAEAEELSKSIDDSRAALAERSTSSARPQSPASSSAGNNPFFKRSASTDIKGVFSPASASPPSQAFGDSSFDDIFGVASSSAPLPGTAVSTPSPAIAAAQQRENMGSSSASPSVSNSAFPPPAVVALSAPEKTTSPAPPGAFPFGEPASIAVAMTPRQTSPALSRAGGDAHSATSQATPAVVHNLATATSLSKSNSPAASSSPFAAPTFSSSPAPASVFPPPDSDVAATSTAVATVANAPTAETDNDPFSSMRANDDPDKAKADFDSAFASFKKSHSSGGDASSTETSKAFTTFKFNSEFPPVEEFDDDSDSSSDAGFDDDFAPSPPQSKPAADVTEPKASQEQPEKTGSPFDMSTTPASKADIFGASPFAAPSAPPTSSVPAQPPAAPSNKASFDDLDDDFEGLEDAKEGSADDDFASLSRSGIDDFGHAFDNTSSSAPSQTKSDSVALGGSGGSFDFVSRGSPPPASAVPPSGPVPLVGSGATTTTGHDWESIFSGPEGGAATAVSADSGALGAIGVATSTPPPATVQSEAQAPGAPPASTQPSTGDQALDNLLMMGYPKEAALRALERYDYNLERAANFLATNS